MSRKRILSGMRPTGRLHIGHWLGALSNWVRLQDEYDCFFMVADYHALMSEYKNPRNLRQYVYENVADWLSWGVDSGRAVVFVQSDVPAHLELYAILSTMTPLGWLYRCPTFKDQIQQLKEKDVNTYAFLGYPVLQAADIALYGAHRVPVGEDQLPHLELAREIARRFNGIAGSDVLIEPQAMLTPVPRLAGLDGRKMSKSFDNCIYLSDDADTVRKKIMGMFTDPARLRKTDPGNPDVCNLFSNYKAFMPESEHETICRECTSAARGCVQCKKLLVESLNDMIQAKREHRNRLLEDLTELDRILDEGKAKATVAAETTMKKVKEALGFFR